MWSFQRLSGQYWGCRNIFVDRVSIFRFMSLRVVEVGALSRLEESPQEYQKLLRSSGEDPLFLNLDWLSAWWNAFGEDKSQLILRVMERGRTVGYAPLVKSSRGRTRWTKVEFMGAGPSDRCGIIAENGRADVQAAVWEHLRQQDEWDVLELRDLRQGGPTERAVRSAFPQAEQVSYTAPCITLNGSHRAYLASLSRNMRYNLGRGWRRLQDEGVFFQPMRTADEVSVAVEWLNELNDQRWQASSTLRTPGMPQFVREVSQRLAGQGVVFHALRTRDSAIAIAMGLEDEGRYLYYLSGFGPELARYSPGTVLLSKIIEECHQLGRKEVDLLRGEEPYKYRFNAQDRAQMHVRTVNRGIMRRTQYALREAPLV